MYRVEPSQLLQRKGGGVDGYIRSLEFVISWRNVPYRIADLC